MILETIFHKQLDVKLLNLLYERENRWFEKELVEVKI